MALQNLGPQRAARALFFFSLIRDPNNIKFYLESAHVASITDRRLCGAITLDASWAQPAAQAEMALQWPEPRSGRSLASEAERPPAGSSANSLWPGARPTSRDRCQAQKESPRVSTSHLPPPDLPEADPGHCFGKAMLPFLASVEVPRAHTLPRPPAAWSPVTGLQKPQGRGLVASPAEPARGSHPE